MKRKGEPKRILNEQALEYFRQMGAIGGHRTANNRTAEERRVAAIKASKARWNRAQKTDDPDTKGR